MIHWTRQRLYASFLALGAIILLFRTLWMILVEDAYNILVWWVFVLLVLELLIDLGCIAGSIRWFESGSREKARLPLQMGASATILHAFRVLIYVLGRVGPWKNFDLKPDFHSFENVDMFWLYFAGILSVAGIVGLIVIWTLIKMNRLKQPLPHKDQLS